MFDRRWRRWGSLLLGRFKAVLVEDQSHGVEVPRSKTVAREGSRRQTHLAGLGVWHGCPHVDDVRPIDMNKTGPLESSLPVLPRHAGASIHANSDIPTAAGFRE